MSKPSFDDVHDNYDFHRAARLTEQWDEIKSRLCVECKYFIQDEFGSFHTCALFAVQSPVDGKTHNRSCSLAREERGGCEPRGVYWEKKDDQKA